MIDSTLILNIISCNTSISNVTILMMAMMCQFSVSLNKCPEVDNYVLLEFSSQPVKCYVEQITQS